MRARAVNRRRTCSTFIAVRVTDVAYKAAVFFFFFSSRRRHTRLQGDWGSDVCSSDLAGYGFDYYSLGAAQRPFSPKHEILRPSGTIGIKLGMLGVLMFFLIYLFPLRKKWGWLGRQGNSRHWLDFHVVLGATAPIIIAFHSSFKFGNIAGMAFWSMLVVTVSGFIGRYLYSQIPRGLSAAELSMKEIQEREETLRKELDEQRVTFGFCVEALYELPTAGKDGGTSMVAPFLFLFFLDLESPLIGSLVPLSQAGIGCR